MKKRDIKIILIHGNGGATAEDHWFPWAKRELEKAGFTVITKNFPDPVLAREKYWLPFIKKLGADKQTILIGHSSGAVAAMRYAQTYHILGSVLISVNYTDLGDEQEKASGYYDHPWNWSAIRNNQNWIIQFASTDDPYIPIGQPRYIHKKLDTEYYEYNNQGHFGGDEKHIKTTFPELLQAFLSKIQ